MIKSKSEMPPVTKIEIDLTGPDGNAYMLLGYASRFAKQFDMDYDIIKAEMTAGDYDQLLEAFDRHFGSFVILYR
jgi:hypothetical protein